MRKGSGIHEMQDVINRCDVDEFSGCWVWKMAVSVGKGGFLTPNARIDGRARPVAGWVWQQVHGAYEPGSIVWRKCRNHRCVNPDHLKCGSRVDFGRWVRDEKVWAGRLSYRIGALKGNRERQRSRTDVAPGSSVFSWRP